MYTALFPLKSCEAPAIQIVNSSGRKAPSSRDVCCVQLVSRKILPSQLYSTAGRKENPFLPLYFSMKNRHSSICII